MTDKKALEQQLLKEWKESFGDGFKLWSELGWWIQKYNELESTTEQKVKADLKEKIEEMKTNDMSLNGSSGHINKRFRAIHIGGYNQALENVLELLSK